MTKKPYTGTLEFRQGRYFLRVVESVAGKKSRPRYDLQTASEDVAIRVATKLSEKLAADKKASPKSKTAFRVVAETWWSERKARGVAMVDSERGWLDNYILDAIGDMLVRDVAPRDVRRIVKIAIDAELARQTVSHIRATVQRILHQAWQDELVEENVALRVAVPRMARAVKKKRVVLTDLEVATFMNAEVDTEVRVLGLVSRCEGGMRTRDLTAWSWSMIALPGFAGCTIPRTKSGAPQELEIPEMLRPALAAWWRSQGEPTDGPVFPVTKGKRKGEARRARGVSFAGRLRHALLVAGVKRHACARPGNAPALKKGEACCAEMARDPLFVETTTSLPVDFHSFRRAFATALAEAGVNTQTAMHLADHADARTHQRYVARTEAMKRVPRTALPNLSLGVPVVSQVEISEPNVDEIIGETGAGHEVRTRDPQLGKMGRRETRSRKRDDSSVADADAEPPEEPDSPESAGVADGVSPGSVPAFLPLAKVAVARELDRLDDEERVVLAWEARVS